MKRTGGGEGGGGGGDSGQGEIIQVQGGHIIRATGRKDRHSKVYTSKGPRDRRVRLSAHTAIQFYDVQDRLGYDRPSKAVDWLIKKAKNAIDKLDELPPHHPNEIGMVVAAPSTDSNPGSTGQALEQQSESSSVYAIHRHLPDNQNGNPGVIPGAVDTSIADTMKSFFPVNPGNSLMNLQSYPGNDRMSRQPSFQTEDLGLSLHSLQDHQNLNHRSYSTEQMLFLGSNPTMFAGQEANYQHKTETWSGAGEGENRNAGFIFNSHSMPQQLFFSQNSAFSQREPLQSNNYSHLFHAWNERQMPSVEHHNPQAITQSSIYNVHFGSNFQVPARIRGDEDPGVGTLQPSSVSPNSNH